jgi:hypothetical protein
MMKSWFGVIESLFQRSRLRKYAWKLGKCIPADSERFKLSILELVSIDPFHDASTFSLKTL